jgi:hypothetical protein
MGYAGPPAEDPPRVVPKPPRGLRSEGRELWKAVVEEFDLRPDELRLLRQAAATSDLIAAMEKEIGTDLVVPGSKGQPVANPLLDQVQKHRMLLARLLGQLALPDDPSDRGLSAARSQSARKAALARWSHG